MTQVLLDSALGEDAVLFHDQYQEGYIALRGDGTEVLRIRSRQFRSWLHYHAYTKLGQPVNTTVVLEAIQTMEGRARHEGALQTLDVRVATYDGALWYDLGCKAVRISVDAWKIIERPPILFRRFNHQVPQVEPERGGNLALLDPLLPSSLKDDQKLLFTVSLITGLIPNIPQTVDVIFGDHGSAKSTLTKIKKALLDPSLIDECTPPNGVHEFIQLLSHHWYLPLGNLTFLPGWMSECISRASTGSGFSKRELYSDDDDIIYKFYRIVGLNGINLVADKADLLDRALLIGDLERIPEAERKGDVAVWTQFAKVKPRVLGAMFDVLAAAIKGRHEVHLTHLPRMVDFTRWGCAATQAMGLSHGAFLQAYDRNIRRQHDEAIEASPLGSVLVAFMEKRTSWEGTASELLEEIQDVAEVLRLESHKGYPRNANWVWRRIKDVKVNLAEKGITCESDKKEGERLIRLQKKTNNNNAVPAVQNGDQ